MFNLIKNVSKSTIREHSATIDEVSVYFIIIFFFMDKMKVDLCHFDEVIDCTFTLVENVQLVSPH